jgi:AcrR family transcriptional regulator
MVDASSPRVLRRRLAQREQILGVAAHLFAEAGPDAVRLDQVAERADVARGTLYSHFATKEGLLAAIIEPVLLATEAKLEELTETEPTAIVQGVLRIWTQLWPVYRDALRIAHTVEAHLPPSLGPIHERVVSKLLRLFSRVGRSGRLRGSPEWAGLLLARLVVPLLETYECLDPSGEAFVEAVSGLLLRRKPAPPHTGSKRS